MALTATLALDIRAFEGGLSRATASLEGFAQKTVKNTNRDLSRMLEEFTGQKVVAESARMAEAVERVGGASRLTEAEQRRVNATVSEAIDKYRALGQEAPAQLLKLQKETAGAVEKTSLLTKGMQILVGVFSVRAFLNAAGDVLDFTGKLTDMAAKTGISAEALQRLNYVTAQSGISLEEISRGAVMMAKNLAGDDKNSATKAVEALGFKVSDLIASGPEQAFFAIGEAIAKIPEPMKRAAVATDIFGRTGADYLPAFTTNMRLLAEQAQNTGSILSNEMVASGDRAGDAITRMKAAGLALMANFLVPVLPAIEALANWAGTALPSALRSAQSGIASLIEAGMRMEVWLLSTATAIAKTVADVPVMGRVFGQSAADVNVLASRAQFAKDALAAFTADGVTPATTAATKAVPAVTNFGDALDRMAGSSRVAAASLGAVQGPSADLLLLESRSIVETGKLTKALELWAKTNSATLAPSIRQVNAAMHEQEPLMAIANANWVGFKGTVTQSIGSTNSFFDRFKAQLGEVGVGAQSLSSLFMQAFTGGGGAVGALKAFATQGLQALMSMIPGIPPWLTQFAGPIVEGLSKLAKKGKDILASMFGGPSSSEKAGRASVAAFEQSLHGALTATQELESGGEDWRRTVIAIRDAYIAAGRTEQEALAAAEKLWKSSTISAEESLRVIEEIKAIMNALPTSKTIEIDVKYNDDGSPANPDGLPTNATQPVGPYIPPAPGSSAMGQMGASQAPVVVVVTTIRRDDIDPVEIGNMAAAAVAQHYPRNGFDLKTIITDSLREA